MEKLKSEQGSSLLSAPIIYISLTRNSKINANAKILAAPAFGGRGGVPSRASGLRCLRAAGGLGA